MKLVEYIKEVISFSIVVYCMVPCIKKHYFVHFQGTFPNFFWEQVGQLIKKLSVPWGKIACPFCGNGALHHGDGTPKHELAHAIAFPSQN